MTRKTMDLKRNISIYYKLVHSDLVGGLILECYFFLIKKFSLFAHVFKAFPDVCVLNLIMLIRNK